MAKSVKDMVRQYERNRYAFSEFIGLAEDRGLSRKGKRNLTELLGEFSAKFGEE